MQKKNNLYPIFDLFDAADGGSLAGKEACRFDARTVGLDLSGVVALSTE